MPTPSSVAPRGSADAAPWCKEALAGSSGADKLTILASHWMLSGDISMRNEYWPCLALCGFQNLYCRATGSAQFLDGDDVDDSGFFAVGGVELSIMLVLWNEDDTAAAERRRATTRWASVASEDLIVCNECLD